MWLLQCAAMPRVSRDISSSLVVRSRIHGDPCTVLRETQTIYSTSTTTASYPYPPPLHFHFLLSLYIQSYLRLHQHTHNSSIMQSPFEWGTISTSQVNRNQRLTSPSGHAARSFHVQAHVRLMQFIHSLDYHLPNHDYISYLQIWASVCSAAC